jgi:hypothetical protein
VSAERIETAESAFQPYPIVTTMKIHHEVVEHHSKDTTMNKRTTEFGLLRKKLLQSN